MSDKEEAPVGLTIWDRPPSPYETFCEKENVPILRGLVGIRDTREVELGEWARMGGRGAFIDLDGTGGKHGNYLIEIPPGGALEPEKHMYEEILFVVEGRGSTEVWVDGQATKSVFEWGQNSVFSPPLNTWHRIINATNRPALLLATTNAPPIMQLFNDTDFIFNSAYHFKKRYNPSDAGSYFDAWEEFGWDTLEERPAYGGALIPDAVSLELPKGGNRGFGHKSLALRNMSGNQFIGFIAQYPPGRYSKTHAHQPGPVLICLAGAGYTMCWPKSAGMTPWQDGNADQVKITEYVPGGMVSAAPGDENWFHGHFGVGGLRVLAHTVGYPQATVGPPGVAIASSLRDIKDGGGTIEYPDEDPMVREIFKQKLAVIGATFDMPDSLYQRGPAK